MTICSLEISEVEAQLSAHKGSAALGSMTRRSILQCRACCLAIREPMIPGCDPSQITCDLEDKTKSGLGPQGQAALPAIRGG